MNSEMKSALEAAGKRLELRNAAVLSPGQDTTAWVLRWLNADDKYEQVKVYHESFISRHEEVTPDSVTAEVRRLIDAGEAELVPR